MDVFLQIVDEILNFNNIRRNINKLDMAEANNLSIVGSAPSKNDRNARVYKQWQGKIIKSIEILAGRGRKLPSFWDIFKNKKSRKF